jgi:hypothetical protein
MNQEDLTPTQRNMIDCLRLFSEDIKTWANPEINTEYRRPSDQVMQAWATTMAEAHELFLQLNLTGNIFKIDGEIIGQIE